MSIGHYEWGICVYVGVCTQMISVCMDVVTMEHVCIGMLSFRIRVPYVRYVHVKVEQ